MQPANKNNVTMLNQGTVFKDIRSFLGRDKKRSENTAVEHERDIRQFFMIVKGKEIENLEPSDLYIRLADVLDYQSFLATEYRDGNGNGYKNITVNRKVSSVRSLYRFLKANEYDVNPDIFREVEELPDDSEKIGFLSPDEARILAELALTEKHDAAEKRVLIMCAVATSMRKDSLLNIRYIDIMPSLDDPNKYIIQSSNLFDKGKQVKKEIHKILFDMIMELKGGRADTDKVFTVSNSAIDRMMKNLIRKANLDPRRNISFHSLRKSGTQLAFELSGGDMFAVTAQGGWSSPTVAYKHYLKPQSNISGMGFFETIEAEVFDELTYEELLALVKGVGNGLGLQLRREAKKIVDGRK